MNFFLITSLDNAQVNFFEESVETLAAVYYRHSLFIKYWVLFKDTSLSIRS